MALSHPIITIALPTSTGIIYETYDLTGTGVDAIIGQALMAQLADAVAGQTFAFTVSTYELSNP
jgi:hypothetical protein